MTNPGEIPNVLSNISGGSIEHELITLAKIGGHQVEAIPEQQERFSPSRLALTSDDYAGREHFQALMQEAGMNVDDDHPLALIGTIQGKDPSLAPVTIMSHYDTVPQADMYDGVLGITAGIILARALKEAGVQTDRNIELLALTGEESSRFKFALFGSLSVFKGLTDKDLLARDDTGISIRDELSELSISTVQVPLYGNAEQQRPLPKSIVELHVEQGRKLQDSNTNIGIVEAIAAPIRNEVTVGSCPLNPEKPVAPFGKFLELSVNGRADHSGATPMGRENRVDGLLKTADVLLPILDNRTQIDNVNIVRVNIKDQALNKVPGITNTILHISAETEEELANSQAILEEYIAKLSDSDAEYPISIQESHEEDLDRLVFNRHDIIKRHRAAFRFIRSINISAESHAAQNVVGTVATINQTDDGFIKLGLDVRGIDVDSRNEMLTDVAFASYTASQDALVVVGDRLPGSGNPVEMDPKLVKAAQSAITENNIGSFVTMFSAAGHDTQNAARAGIPSVMLFVPSRDGIAHNPDAYTSPEDLERGVKALAALVMNLANTH